MLHVEHLRHTALQLMSPLFTCPHLPVCLLAVRNHDGKPLSCMELAPINHTMIWNTSSSLIHIFLSILRV
ncbi:hypothetical protein BDV40DRAFT_256533, partial [Aspergillus tamarii]